MSRLIHMPNDAFVLLYGTESDEYRVNSPGIEREILHAPSLPDKLIIPSGISQFQHLSITDARSNARNALTSNNLFDNITHLLIQNCDFAPLTRRRAEIDTNDDALMETLHCPNVTVLAASMCWIPFPFMLHLRGFPCLSKLYLTSFTLQKWSAKCIATHSSLRELSLERRLTKYFAGDNIDAWYKDVEALEYLLYNLAFARNEKLWSFTLKHIHLNESDIWFYRNPLLIISTDLVAHNVHISADCGPLVHCTSKPMSSEYNVPDEFVSKMKQTLQNLQRTPSTLQTLFFKNLECLRDSKTLRTLTLSSGMSTFVNLPLPQFAEDAVRFSFANTSLIDFEVHTTSAYTKNNTVVKSPHQVILRNAEKYVLEFVRDATLILAPLNLPAYVLMWIFDFLWLVAEVKPAKKIHLIQGIITSRRAVFEARK